MKRTQSKFQLAVITAIVVLACSMQVARSALVAIQIAGTVRSVYDGSNILGGAIQAGDALVGTYYYDSEAVDGNSSETVGDYRHSDADYGITVNINDIIFRTNPNDVDFLVEIANDHGGRDNYLLRSSNNLFGISAYDSGSDENTISWQLDDPSQSALSSDGLPAQGPVVSEWQSIFGFDIESRSKSMFNTPGYGYEFFIKADITSVMVIPEPSVCLLVPAVGLTCLRRSRGYG